MGWTDVFLIARAVAVVVRWWAELVLVVRFFCATSGAFEAFGATTRVGVAGQLVAHAADTLIAAVLVGEAGMQCWLVAWGV